MRDGGENPRRPQTGGGTLGKALAWAYRYKVYLLLAAILAVMAQIAPRFLTAGNFGNILKAAGINLPAAAGFNIVMICGQLDLSIGSAMTLGGMMTVGLEPHIGWAGGFAAALACGLVLGLANGLLVAKARINSFIVTLGTMIIVQNAVFIYCGGGTIPARGFALSDWLQPAGAVVTPAILIQFAVVALAAMVLRWTPVGRGFYLLGGNVQTAWFSGLRTDRYVVGAFVLSSTLSTFGGALVAMSEAGANPTLGDGALMAIVAAVIIGGTSMAGGKGSLVDTAAALVALAALINGLNCRGEGYEVQLMAGGLVLALVILYDAFAVYRREKKRGRRQDLLRELHGGHI
ncbi:MAG: ABC transporter permease [Planctomycetota bacterium]|nr:ABC transporter permease [Planctomycetota bacterium]